jgi:hypothetical protein
MNKLFERFYSFSNFGPAIKCIKPTSETVNSFEDKLPVRLIENWLEYGFCGWGEGIFWTVDPADYKDILDTWLQGTSFENKDNYYVIAHNAFGNLRVWGERSGYCLEISSAYGMLFPSDNTEKMSLNGDNKMIDLFFASSRKERMDMKDLDEKPLFQRAMAKLGPLDADEMYGFVPALAIGGAPRLENLQKVKIIEHLTFLADLGEKTVMADIVAMSNALHK